MEVKKMECEIVEHNKEDNNTHITTIVFTTCIFLVMVCLKYFIVEQWRLWVFLLLNVILLSILFMSMRTSYKGQSYESGTSVEEAKGDKKVKKGQCYECCEENEEVIKECYKQQCWTSTCTNNNVHVHVHVENEEEEEEEEVALLSKEELNERVEAFITMFREHLISDVKQAENLRFQKSDNFTTKIEVPCC